MTHDLDKESFEAGVLWATARIVELHDQPVIAADVLRESGIAISLRRVDVADRRYLRQVLEEPYFRKQRKHKS